MQDEIKIKYKILSVDEKEQSMVVRYWTDFITENDLAMSDQKNADGSPVRCRTDYNINIWDHINNETALHDMLIGCAPIDWFKLQYKVQHPEIDHTLNGSLSFMKNLINKPIEKTIVTKKVEELSDTDIEALLEKITTQTTNT